MEAFLATGDPYGLIAEEVAEIYPGLVARSAEGQIETVMYQFLPPMLLNEYQKQQRTIDRLVTQLQAKTAEIDRFKSAVAEIAELKAQVARLARALDMGSTSATLDVK